MESDLALLYLAIGSRVSSSIIADNVLSESNKVNTDKYVELTFSFMNTPQVQPKIIQEVPSSLGSCFGLIDERDYVFLAVGSENYPRATLRTIVAELRNEFYQTNPAAEHDLLEARAVNSRFIYELGLKYNRPEGISKTAEAQQKLREVQLQMQENLKKTMGGQDQMRGLEVKSHEMNVASKAFEESSGQLESMMKWRNCKLWAILACVVIAILLYIFVPIIANSTK